MSYKDYSKKKKKKKKIKFSYAWTVFETSQLKHKVKKNKLPTSYCKKRVFEKGNTMYIYYYNIVNEKIFTFVNSYSTLHTG